MKIRVWKGFHSQEIQELIQRAWKNEELLLLLPPGMETGDTLALLEKTQFPEAPIFGIYSSGTTGRKLVLYSKRNILSSLEGIRSLFDEKRIGQIFCYPQPFHTFGLILGYCQSLIYECPLVALEGEYNHAHHVRWKQCLTDNQMTLGTPTHFKDLLHQHYKPRESYTAIIGAAKVERTLWKSMRDSLHIQSPSIGYGATEASPGITHLPPGQEPMEDGEVGYVLPHVQVEHNEYGFSFSGPNVCLAIVENGQVQFPNSILVKDHLEKTSGGVLKFLGRKDLLLNRGGEKFSLEAIESTLKEKLGIEALCTSIHDSRLGEELGILACTNIEHRGKIYTVLKHVYGRDFNPANFKVTDTLPQTSTHKPDRKAAKESILEH